jgi:DNA-binding transcriptional LysR family regulator
MASFPTAGATLMPLAVATFRAAHPAVDLTMVEGEPEEILPRLEDGDLDLALLFEFEGFSEPIDPGTLQRVDLMDDDMYVALPPGHRLAERRAVRLADLRDEAWVQTSVSSPCARHVVRACHGAGFEPRVSFESDDYLTVQGLVAAGVGVALIPGLALTYVRPEIVIRELSPRGPFRRVLAAAAPPPARDPATEAMLEILRRIPGTYQPPGIARVLAAQPS